ncbi:MAG: carbohydrate ABC transporter permease [Lachnospiraceae bacterium]|nr:carbohydrate ABC transporter permease [Lachnospiraceae bacterium]
MKFKHTTGEKIFDVFLYIFLGLLAVLFIYPFWTVIAMSFNSATDTMRGGIILWPREFTLNNYRAVFKDNSIFQAYFITIARTVIGTIGHLLFTSALAYGLSKKHLMFRKTYFNLCIITMFFSGGMIPGVLNIFRLGLGNSFLVYVVPGLYSVYDMIIIKSFFNAMPQSLEESAKIDGANDLVIFFRIVLPNAKAVLATIGLATAVGQWNAWFDAYLYVDNPDLWPVQLLLQRVIASATSMSDAVAQNPNITAGSISPYSVQLATIIVAIGPIILIYPFFQKYFVKGMMIGAIKE